MKREQIILKGRPTTKKNSQRVVRMGDFTKVLPSKQYEEYENACLWQLMRYKHIKFDMPVHITCHYYMPNRKGWPDLQGLLQATADILEKAAIIEDDRLIVLHDGSRILDIDPANPRVEILIEELPATDAAYRLDPYVVKKVKEKAAVNLF